VVDEVILVFDRTKQTSVQDLVYQDGSKTKLTICSASPQFQISDDALVDWCGKLDVVATKPVFITSDRGL